MLTGTSSLETLIPNIPRIESYEVSEVVLSEVEILQIQYEMSAGDIQKLLPPALDATLPPLGQWTLWSVQQSPWGPFNLVQFRLSCRSGARPRSFLLSAAINNEDAGRVLSEHWGLASILANVDFKHSYESAEVIVSNNSKTLLEFQALDPEPLADQDVQFFASMHAANTPHGLRLVQFDPTYETMRVERYTPSLSSFKSDTWGAGSTHPHYPVIGFGLRANIHLPKIRFVCRPDVSAFQGTEEVGA